MDFLRSKSRLEGFCIRDAEVARSNRADPIQMTNTVIVYTNSGLLGQFWE